MRIMIFSNSPWDNTNATGNTLSNFFDKSTWGNDVFYNIYMRSAMPKNDICKNFYRLLLIDMIKHYFCKEKIGYAFTSNDTFETDKEIKNEKKIIDLIHKYSLNIAYLIADYIYRRKKWINKKFMKFVDDANPDVFYAHVNNFAILSPLIEYVKKNKHAKIVLLLTDDLYNDIDNKMLIRRRKLKKDYWNIINNADKIYAISSELQEEYSTIFNKKIDLLYKGCSFDYPVKNKLNEVIRFVYAGNLFYGRDEILAKIGEAIKKSNNKNKQKAILEIYTGATITVRLRKKLNIESSSILIGRKEYDEIKKIMNEAEFNLEVESFEQKQIDLIRYSFSTKIIDCLQSGSSILAIGPSTVSSIKYMKKIPGVFVIDSVNNIENEIEQLIINKQNILNNASIIRKYALENHGIERNQKKMREDFIKLIDN